MKKSLFLKLVLTAVLVFTFTGCGSDQEVDSSSSDANIQEELSAETPDDGMSADKEDVSGTPDQDKEDTSSVASSGGADKTSKPADSDAKPSGGSNNSADTGNTGNSGSDSGNTNSDAGAAKVPSKSTAQSYIGKSASSLIAAIGAPSAAQYSPSCMGDGEDGQLSYSGFTVYTYRENGQEKVVDVE